MPVRVKDMDWPLWAPVGLAVAVVALAASILVQRHALWPLNLTTVGVAVVALPWILDCLLHLPEWLFSALVLAGATVLFLHPAMIDISPFFLVLLAGREGMLSSPKLAVAVALSSAGVLIAFDLTHRYSGAQLWSLGIGMAALMGAVSQRQLVLLDELRAAQADLADRAAQDERRRIAREIHDVVAHSLTVTMLHLSGARLALDSDPAEAAEALAEAERLGRQSLADIRRTVGLLGDNAGVTRALPTAAEIPALVAGFARAGLDVEFSCSGDALSLAPTVGLCLYRVTQEAVANVAKHAPGSSVRVGLVVGDEDVRLCVRDGGRERGVVPAGSNGSADGVSDDGAGGGAGMGVAGMRDRVTSLGGTFRVLAADGGWTVEAVVPRAPE